MATSAWSTVAAHISNVEFRTYWGALASNLVSLGLTQTADTGQINWATVINGYTVNAVSGYEVYRFSDSLQATYPIFIKIEYGYTASLNVPCIYVTVGTGSNGSGTITGTQTPRLRVANYIGLDSLTIPYLSLACVLPGYVMVCFKMGSICATPNCNLFFSIARTVDNTGAMTGDGVMVMHSYSGNAANIAPYCTQLGFAENFVSGDGPWYTFFPYNMTNSQPTVNEIQLHKCYGFYPRVICNPYIISNYYFEILGTLKFVCAPIGATSHTYISLGRSGGQSGYWNSDANRCMSVVYE